MTDSKSRAFPWLFEKGASDEALRILTDRFPELPSTFVELLRRGNGGEVGLSVNPFNFCLYPVEHSLDYYDDPVYPLQGVFVFGGNGGGCLLAFELSRKPFRVVSFDPIDPEGSIEEVAIDFDSFMEFVETD